MNEFLTLITAATFTVTVVFTGMAALKKHFSATRNQEQTQAQAFSRAEQGRTQRFSAPQRNFPLGVEVSSSARSTWREFFDGFINRTNSLIARATGNPAPLGEEPNAYERAGGFQPRLNLRDTVPRDPALKRNLMANPPVWEEILTQTREERFAALNELKQPGNNPYWTLPGSPVQQYMITCMECVSEYTSRFQREFGPNWGDNPFLVQVYTDGLRNLMMALRNGCISLTKNTLGREFADWFEKNSRKCWLAFSAEVSTDFSAAQNRETELCHSRGLKEYGTNEIKNLRRMTPIGHLFDTLFYFYEHPHSESESFAVGSIIKSINLGTIKTYIKNAKMKYQARKFEDSFYVQSLRLEKDEVWDKVFTKIQLLVDGYHLKRPLECDKFQNKGNYKFIYSDFKG